MFPYVTIHSFLSSPLPLLPFLSTTVFIPLPKNHNRFRFRLVISICLPVCLLAVCLTLCLPGRPSACLCRPDCLNVCLLRVPPPFPPPLFFFVHHMARKSNPYTRARWRDGEIQTLAVDSCDFCHFAELRTPPSHKEDTLRANNFRSANRDKKVEIRLMNNQTTFPSVQMGQVAGNGTSAESHSGCEGLLVTKCRSGNSDGSLHVGELRCGY